MNCMLSPALCACIKVIKMEINVEGNETTCAHLRVVVTSCVSAAPTRPARLRLELYRRTVQAGAWFFFFFPSPLPLHILLLLLFLLLLHARLTHHALSSPTHSCTQLGRSRTWRNLKSRLPKGREDMFFVLHARVCGPQHRPCSPVAATVLRV